MLRVILCSALVALYLSTCQASVRDENIKTVHMVFMNHLGMLFIACCY